MALSITHSYVSAVPDAGDASLVQPSDWNDVHDITGLGAGVETFLGTPSSANLASAVTDETGSGALVFANTPTLVTPVLGAATGTSVVLSGKLEAASIELGHASANTLTASGGVLSIEGVALLSTASVIPLTVGTTTIASGNDTRILYNNAGVLGQYTLTGTGTVVVMQTAPSFLTSITTPIATITQGTITDPATALNLTTTWNDAADTFVAARINVTNTASAAASLLLDLQVGGTSYYSFRRGGALYFPVSADAYISGDGSYAGLFVGSAGAGNTIGLAGNTGSVRVTNTFELTGASPGSAGDVILARDAANTLALRNGASAQIFNIYNTYTDPATYVRMSLASTSVTLQATSGDATMYMVNSTNNSMDFYTNNAERWRITAAGHWITMGADNTYDIGASGATRPRTGYFGTSVVTPIATITQGTITDTAPQINGTVTWNDAADTFTAWKLNVTNTNSHAESKLVDLQVGGSSMYDMRATGLIVVNGGNLVIDGTANQRIMAGGIVDGTGLTAGFKGINFLSANGFVGWASSASASGDVFLVRDAANTLALRNSTADQQFSIYKTYTDASNYARAGFYTSGSTFLIAWQAAGSGSSSRNIRLQSSESGTHYFEVDAGGNAYSSTTIGTASDFLMQGQSSGVVTLYNWDSNDFGRLQFGGTTSSFPALKRSTTYLQMRLADDSAYADFACRASVTPRTSELTIAAGVITATGSYHSVDTEADAASDDLDTINGGVDGMRLVLRASDSGRTVVVKDATGNIQCGGDRSLDNIQDTMELIYDGVQTAWLEIAFASNGA
jgi:hypothetical protein